jgi:hypothetical protein
MIRKSGIEDIIEERKREQKRKEAEAHENRQKALEALWNVGGEGNECDEWAEALDAGDGYNSPGGSSDGYNSPEE